MAHDPIPSDVEEFIESMIDSVATMEALMLAYRERPTTWSAAAVARRLYVDEPRAAASLQRLADHDILQCESGQYRFAPRGGEFEALVIRVIHTYDRQLIAVTNLIHARVKPSITEFANAFRLRKDK